MKFLALLLSLYFITVSVVPCAEICVELVTENPIHSPQETESGDDCSTVCVCTCCGITFHVSKAEINLAAPFIHPQFFAVTPVFTLKDNFSIIWQPPKTA